MTPVPAPRKTGSPVAAPQKRKRRRPIFNIDRIVLMRAAFAVTVVLFLYMMFRISVIAFGGGALRDIKRIESATDGSTARESAPAGTTKPANPPPQ